MCEGESGALDVNNILSAAYLNEANLVLQYPHCLVKLYSGTWEIMCKEESMLRVPMVSRSGEFAAWAVKEAHNNKLVAMVDDRRYDVKEVSLDYGKERVLALMPASPFKARLCSGKFE